MVPIKTIVIELNKQPEDVISRLKWKLHRVDTLLLAKTNTLTSESNKPLIGKYDKKSSRFSLTRLRPFNQTLFPQLIASGIISKRDNTTILTIKFKYGFITTIITSFLIYATTTGIYNMIINGTFYEVFYDFVFGIIIFPVIPVLLTILEYKKTLKLIKDIIGVD